MKFTKKSCKSAKQEHPKISEELGKIKNENSRGLRRLYRGRNSVSRSQDNLYESKHPKRRKNGEKGPVTHLHAPRA